MRALILVFVSFLSIDAWSFLPPVSQMVRDVFEGRKSAPASEMIVRHHIEVRSGEAVDIEEQYIGDSQHGTFVLRGNGGTLVGGGVFDKRAYSLNGDRKFASKTNVWRKYLFSASSEDFLNSLLGERFLSKEALQQYKAGFNPVGEPQGWDVKNNVLHHDGIYLRRARGNPSYYVSSPADDGKENKGIFFDKGLAGVRRVEWKEAGELWGWNFDGFSKFQSPGTFPRRLSLDRNGNDVVSSEVFVHRPAKDRQIQDMRNQARGAPALSGNYEEAVRILLSYR